MSQVVTTKDQLSEKRLASLEQERSIKKDAFLKKWQRSDISQTTMFERFVAVVLLPFAALWTVISMIIAVVMGLIGQILKLFSSIFSVGAGSKKLP